MGQPSIHFLNKAGKSMFWNSMWDSKLNYTNFLKEDEFFKKYVNHLYNDCFSINLFRFKKSKISLKKKIRTRKETFNYSVRNLPIIYSTKVWVLRYQNWVILYNYFYISKLKKITKKDMHALIDPVKYHYYYNRLFLKNFFFYKQKIPIFF